MYFFIRAITSLSVVITLPAVLVYVGLGALSFRQEYADYLPLAIGILACAGLFCLARLISIALTLFIEKRLQTSPPYHHWNPEKRLCTQQTGIIRPSFQLERCLNVLPFIVLLPFYYYLLPGYYFIVPALILLVYAATCFFHLGSGLVSRPTKTTYYPQSEEFIDFYLRYLKKAKSSSLKDYLEKIKKSSLDYGIANHLFMQRQDKYIFPPVSFDHIDISFGPGFEATAENLKTAQANLLNANKESVDHLG